MQHASSPLRFAYKKAHEIMESRDGAGFRFIITMNSGKTFDVTTAPDDDLHFPEDSIPYWECELGENPFVIRHSEIAAIEVYEC